MGIFDQRMNKLAGQNPVNMPDETIHFIDLGSFTFNRADMVRRIDAIIAGPLGGDLSKARINTDPVDWWKSPDN
ncbi:hypothetical protein [Rosistilla oblonga]|uniref:hypothetical protein n=1 Tax=Rosistilla oblonga TaxID=2527990 RepID=UPI003A97539E